MFYTFMGNKLAKLKVSRQYNNDHLEDGFFNAASTYVSLLTLQDKDVIKYYDHGHPNSDK